VYDEDDDEKTSNWQKVGTTAIRDLIRARPFDPSTQTVFDRRVRKCSHK